MPKGNTAQPPQITAPATSCQMLKPRTKTRGPKPTYRPTKSIFTQESLQLQLPFPQSQTIKSIKTLWHISANTR